AIAEWRRRNRSQFMTADIPSVPAVKPPYRAFEAGSNGRIWVQRHVAAEKREPASEPREDGPPPLTWREPVVYDVFESDGTYMGEVRLPPRTSIHWIGRDHVWAVARGELDESYVVKLRIQTAAPSDVARESGGR
ncbi:MAG: hypothetical protein ACREK1_12875, partial [Longimicrobiales bacterium]